MTTVNLLVAKLLQRVKVVRNLHKLKRLLERDPTASPSNGELVLGLDEVHPSSKRKNPLKALMRSSVKKARQQ